jgi:2-polyprenyl-6-methoxyphenol hydroxylase-like FAD-dependent oxidoreductase
VTFQPNSSASAPKTAASTQAGGETIVVMGGGIAGLGIALSLRESNHQVVIVERDQPPPEIDPARAFDDWKRPGVFQFWHPHVFLGRLHRLLRDHHPELLQELRRAGFWELPVSEYGIFRNSYEPAPEDADLTQLCGRRATFEYVLQRYVRALPNVRVLYGSTVESIALAGEGEKLQVRSIEIKRGDTRETLTGDFFIDCLGRRSPVFKWLSEHGRNAKEQRQDAHSLYFSRHYKLHDGKQAQLDEQSGDLDFLRFAIIYGEGGHFAIGFSVDESDTELVQMIKRAEGFERVCHAIPQLKDWVEKADPLTAVMGMGDIRNRWTHSSDRGRPLVLGLLHVGDSAHETNPFYGRGCSAALVDAHLVAAALLASSDPLERARTFAERVRIELLPYYDVSVAADRMFQARSMAARGLRVPLSQRLVAHAYLTLAVPAAFEDASVARALLGIQHMRKPYGVLTGLRLMARMLYLAVRRLGKQAKPAPAILPQRSQIMLLPRE